MTTILDLHALQEIVVAGGAGFVGSHVVDTLLERCPRAHIRVLDALTPSAELSNLRSAFESGRVSLFHGDIANPEIVDRVTDGVDLIVNLAGETSMERAAFNAAHVHAAMVTGAQVLADAMRRNAVPVMVHVSSASVYGRSAVLPCNEAAPFYPLHPLAAGHAAAEMVIRSHQESHGLDIRVLRPVTIFGARQDSERLLGRFIRQALSGRALTLHGAGSQIRSFVSVTDVCDALFAVLQRGVLSGVYNVGTAEEYSVVDIANRVLACVPDNPAGYIAMRDRPAQDSRRVVDSGALADLDWSPRWTLAGLLPKLIMAQARQSVRVRQRLSAVPPLAPGDEQDGTLFSRQSRRPKVTRH